MKDYNDKPFNRFWKKEKKVRRNYEIEDDLFEILEKLCKEEYDADIVDLVNASIEFLIHDKDFVLERTEENKPTFPHVFRIFESNVIGLEKMKSNFGGVSITTLVNLAIRKALKSQGYLDN